LKKIKFIAIAGSSAGHILPAIKYLNCLSEIKEPSKILFITNDIGKNYLNKIKNNKINKLIVSSKNKFSFILKIFFNVSLLFLFNRKIILIGFGGFITTPVLLISKLFNIIFLSSNKIYIHEQNIIFGLANKINYLIAKNVFISFPKVNIRCKEIFVGNFFFDTNKPRQKLDDKFVNVLLMGGSAGSLELNNRMLEEIKILDWKYIKKTKFFIQIPDVYVDIYKKKYEDLVDNDNFSFFVFENNLNFQEYDFILSRSGSGSINEILYYTNNVFFMPHLISRDQHQKFNLNYFSSHNMSLKKFQIPNKKNITSKFYFNSLINPHTIEKIICYTTR
tara:strand:- start:456 stop:1457 length:1002 start_codon:yes stop_codon:yes gene_type:complete